MKITIISVGKIKETYFIMGISEYVKRLSRYCKLEIIQVADEKTPDGASELEEIQIREREGKRILNYIKDNSYVITLVIDGNMIDSIELSKKIEQLAVSGFSNLIFIIGGSLGLSKEVQQRADYLLSFSKLTFPHQMMRLIVLEQIYRSFRIINHEPYHK